MKDEKDERDKGKRGRKRSAKAKREGGDRVAQWGQCLASERESYALFTVDDLIP